MFGFSIGARKGFLPILAFFLTLAAQALAADSAIEITHAWARPTPPSATTAAIYLTITNKGAADDVLTGISTPAAGKAELHATSNENGIMKMAAVGEEPVKAGDKIVVSPGGLHIMLTGLAHPLKAGDMFPLTLTFRNAGQVETTVTVEASAKPHGEMPNMPGMKM